MRLGICTIQRDRSPWLVEWLAFHYVVGFRKFYFYAHHCQDDSVQKLHKLMHGLDLKVFVIPDKMDRVQLMAYQHAYDNFGHEVDWMAFVDSDEFLFPSQATSMEEVFEPLQYERISALASYWVCFGSNGHQSEPAGLILDNYQMRPDLSFERNAHVKSIVRGRQTMQANQNAHVFETQWGTVDELGRTVDKGFMQELQPSWDKLRINHYICQSWQYYVQFKHTSGFADAGSAGIRPDNWWTRHDRNEVHDQTILRFRDATAAKVQELEALIRSIS